MFLTVDTSYLVIAANVMVVAFLYWYFLYRVEMPKRGRRVRYTWNKSTPQYGYIKGDEPYIIVNDLGVRYAERGRWYTNSEGELWMDVHANMWRVEYLD